MATAKKAEEPCSVCVVAIATRKGLCRACYLRKWRGAALPPNPRCVVCGEKRRIVLRWCKIGRSRIVTCQNCGFIADKMRPRAKSAEQVKETRWRAK